MRTCIFFTFSQNWYEDPETMWEKSKTGIWMGNTETEPKSLVNKTKVY